MVDVLFFAGMKEKKSDKQPYTLTLQGKPYENLNSGLSKRTRFLRGV